MPEPDIPSSRKSPELKLPESRVYTRDFDRTCSAREVLAEFIERGNWLSQKHIVPTFSKEMKDKLVSMAHAYRSKSLELYWYIPPIVFITDNSGSLRWRTAGCLEWLLREISSTFEHAYIPFEILWYTTREWTWGKSKKKWIENGRPRWQNGEWPGRLNDIQYTIFKSFWEKHWDVQDSYSLLWQAWYLKENIDGEALVWAYERASERSEQIKHIIHLSDGAPVDDSTMANNSGDFLTSHLHHVLTALQNDENTKVHLWYIGEELSAKYRENPYGSYTLLNPSWNPLEDFMEGVFSSLVDMDIEELINQRREIFLNILWVEFTSLWEADILSITRNFNPEILEILREFGYSWIDILLNVSHPIWDIDERIFRMNLWIIKHSWKDFGAEFWKLLPILTHYPYHEHLQIIVENTVTIDAIIRTLQNSDAYIQLTQWRDWQRKFFEKYRTLIEQDRLNKDILSLLIDGKHISEEDVDDLYIILQFWNLETVKLLLWELKIPYTMLKKEKDILEYSDVNKLRNNMQLLRGKWITHNSQIELLRFSMSVNTLMLQAAIQYGLKTFKKLRKNKSLLEQEYTPQSEKELFQNIFLDNEKVSFSRKLRYRWPIISYTWIQWGIRWYQIFQDIENLSGWLLIEGAIFFTTTKNTIKDFLWIKNKVAVKTKDAVILRTAYKKFKAIVDRVAALWYWKISKKMIEELEDCYEDIVWIQDKEVQEKIGVDRDKVRLQYNVLRVCYLISLFPDLSLLKNNSIAEEILRYLQEILNFEPSYVINNGFNYKFFLAQKSKLQWAFGAHFWESERIGDKSVLTAEVSKAYMTLWVKPSSTKDEVVQAYKKLVREHHPDRHGWNDAKMKQVNNAKDIIDRYRGWN